MVGPPGVWMLLVPEVKQVQPWIKILDEGWGGDGVKVGCTNESPKGRMTAER